MDDADKEFIDDEVIGIICESVEKVFGFKPTMDVKEKQLVVIRENKAFRHIQSKQRKKKKF
jgi:hypothetical protein